MSTTSIPTTPPTSAQLQRAYMSAVGILAELSDPETEHSKEEMLRLIREMEPHLVVLLQSSDVSVPTMVVCGSIMVLIHGMKADDGDSNPVKTIFDAMLTPATSKEG